MFFRKWHVITERNNGFFYRKCPGYCPLSPTGRDVIQTCNMRTLVPVYGSKNLMANDTSIHVTTEQSLVRYCKTRHSEVVVLPAYGKLPVVCIYKKHQT